MQECEIKGGGWNKQQRGQRQDREESKERQERGGSEEEAEEVWHQKTVRTEV